MNKAVIGLFCVFLAVASAQLECMQAIQASIPEFEKMYSECTANKWVDFETDLEKFIPTARLILTSCAGYNITDTPRVQACITNGEGIARLLAPILVNPEDMTALYKLLFQLPGYLSAFYGQCINPVDIKNDFDYVSVLLEQKAREGDIYNCISSAMAMLPTLKKLTIDIVSQADVQTIQEDLAQIGGQVYTVCDNCGIPRPEKLFQVNDVEQCMARVMTLYNVIESILNANGDIPKILQGIKALVMLVPAALNDCGIKI